MSNPHGSTPSIGALGHLILRYADWLVGLGVLGLMLTLISPMPPVALDMLLALNMATALMLLLVTLNVRDAAELSTFPTILLFATLFRLGLNVASTRMILSGGDAGSIITAFGAYVVQDNLLVGMIVFLVLIIIQFVVITKGAGRISEVAARFVLDAMPGKQMAIDADLNAGLIDADDARDRRAQVATEAEFYGAMDGASKFVRGDAIAGLIITALNLLGGIAIGIGNSMTMAEAGERYSKLTIGDGLVSQIPALFVSTAAAVLTTRATGRSSLGQSLAAQIGSRPRATLIAGGMLFAIAILPGMPALPFLILASILALVWRSTREVDGAADLMRAIQPEEERVAAVGGQEEELDPEQSQEREVADLLGTDRVALEIGYRLIPLVKDVGGAGLLDHVSQLRKRIASRDGVVLPPVRIKDNIRLGPNAYRVVVGGVEIAAGEVEPGAYLAMDGGVPGLPELAGKPTVDPAFGLPAVWIGEADRDEAELLGYTVIDATSVAVTHLSEVLTQAFPDILSRDDVKQLIEAAKLDAPTVVEELVPERMNYGEIQAVLRNLLREGVALKNMPAILEALSDGVQKTKDTEALTEVVRQRLARSLCERFADPEGTIHAVTIDPEVETRLTAALGGRAGAEAEAVGPAYLSKLVETIEERLGEAARGGREAVLLVRSGARRFVGELIRSTLPKVAVLSFNEVVPARSVETLGVVRMED